MLEELNSSVPGHVYNFMLSPTRSLPAPSHGTRWMYRDQKFALTVYLKSSAAKNVLRKYLNLLSQATLRYSILEIAKRPGFCPATLQATKSAAATLTDNEKICIFSFSSTLRQPYCIQENVIVLLAGGL